MSSFDDDLNEMGAAAGLYGDGSIAGDSRGSGQFADPSPVMAQFLRELGALGDGPPPAPSVELAAVFDGVASRSAARRRRSTLRTHRVGVAIAAAAISTAALTGVAAANERLPQPAQTVVARVVNDLTPFHVDPSHLPASHNPTPPPTMAVAPPTESSRPTETEPTETEPGQPGPISPAPAEQSEPGDSQATGAAPGGEDRAGPTSTSRRSSAADPTSDGAGDGAGD